MIMAPVLPEWLTPDDVSWFESHHLGRAPYARPAAALDALPVFTWETLGDVLGSDAPVDVLTVAAGQTVPVPRPPKGPNARRPAPA